MNFDTHPQTPHGGTLVDRMVADDDRAAAVEHARSLPSIRVDLEAAITVEMIATGVLSPITGFMTEVDYLSVLDKGRLTNGLVWPVPLSFAPTGDKNAETISGLDRDDEVALIGPNGEPIAILTVADLFDYDKDHRARSLFGTGDRAHPGVDSIHRRMGDVSIGGPITMLRRVDWGPFEKLRREPSDTWRLFYEENDFASVAGFITGANPVHRGHEYIHRNALEEVDALFVQPLVEMAKREYVRHEFRMLAYRNVLDHYYPKDRTILSPLRVTYIFAGPRETILHALIMKNYGCTHALIGRDHAGIGSFYDKYASHTVFDEFRPEELGIEVRLFHEVFYCARCSAHGTTQTCPHDERHRLNISGTGIRELLRHGLMPPKEIVRPEAALAAMQGVQPKGLDEDGESIEPVGNTIRRIFPAYTERIGLGGPERPVPLTVEDLTGADLTAAITDARENATRIYADVYELYRATVDHDPATRRTWLDEARADLRSMQERLISDLDEKVDEAPEDASDEFMYQPRSEAEEERRAAEALLADVAPEPDGENGGVRVWNPLPYHRYRGPDED